MFDLDDLLRRAAEETKQGLAEGLAQDAQTGEGGETGREMGVAAPREGVGEAGKITVEAEINLSAGATAVASGVGADHSARPVAERRIRAR